ncbi:MAG: PqqD family protein [Deltaproteobacteria bacterium]|nr:MAG: PqqD family protein [Deltaproteobacteria bacterium]
MDFSRKLQFSETVLAREIDDEMVLLDMNTENYFGLDTVASDIWRLLQEGKTLQETYDALLETYDVDPEQLRQDLKGFVESLIAHKLATPV